MCHYKARKRKIDVSADDDDCDSMEFNEQVKWQRGRDESISDGKKRGENSFSTSKWKFS